MKRSMLAAALAAVLVLAGCGSDDTDATPDEGDVPSATVEAIGGSSSTTSGGGSDDDPFCNVDDELSGISDALTPLLLGASSNAADMQDALDTFYDSLDDLQGAVDAAVDKAPAEIKDDVRTLANGVVEVYGHFPDRDEFESALQKAATDPAAVQTLLADLLDGFGELEQDADFAKAQANVEEWTASHCG